MEVRPDNKLAAFAANLWRPIDATPDPAYKPVRVSRDGVAHLPRPAPEGPENDEERFHALVANAAKPSRWFNIDDFSKMLVVVSKRGKLIGDVGYGFTFVDLPEDADGETHFTTPWEVV
ncbi:MAG: hypothetical protein JW829_11115 [Pirellulales bacterium]|nr:hypothetical protein [Pirellulales bacterium]